MPATNVTVNGAFTVNRYALIYMVDGEVYATDSIEYGATITLREEPVKEGYTFSGWSEVPETMPAADVTVNGGYVSGINNITTDSQLVDVYTLDGILVKKDIDIKALSEELSTGIYIINGKKCWVK